jgi:alginate O-acetyltransferase complex protein AlgI
MLFPSFLFALFFLPVWAGSWCLQCRPLLNKVFLVCASYVFYAAWDWRFCGLLFGSSVANHIFAHGVHQAEGRCRKGILAIAVAANLTLLAYFKYYGFFASSFDSLAISAGFSGPFPLFNTILPVGISFITFHGISYVTDVYRKETAPARSLLDVLLYISFFPHLVAGPIVRASYFLPQLDRPVYPAGARTSAAVALIVFGLFKKVLIADLMSSDLVTPAFQDPSQHCALDLWIGMYAFAVQIFCDFSAYTDIATGVAALFGFSFTPNFDRPYGSTSLQIFWTRWHISLSTWLRDYLYIPLGGSRNGKIRTCLNLFITMALGGLWHGSAWTFILWGLLHGTALVAERLSPLRLPKAAGWLLTFHVVCLGWILFRSPDLATAGAYLQGMFNWHSGLPWTGSILATAVTCAGIAAHFLPKDVFPRCVDLFSRLPWLLQGASAAVTVQVIAAFGPDGIPPFIYFAF